MYIFLDDQRYPNQVTWVNLPLYNWTIVRNYNEFIKLIKKNGLPKFISFDHDLALEHLPIFEKDIKLSGKIEIPYQKYKEKTGYDCAKWLVDYCLDTNQSLPEYAVHSMNPIGKENIKKCLGSFEYYKNFLKTLHNKNEI